MRLTRPPAVTAFLYSLLAFCPLAARSATKPHIFQSPALSQNLIAFAYAGDLWTVPREGGRANRLTNGVGIESTPVFSPDGATIAFTGQYDGNTDVFTIPSTGGIPHRVTYHPAADVAVGWTPDGQRILFRSNRQSWSHFTRLFVVAAAGGFASPLPLPTAYDGKISPDGSHIAYTPLPPVSSFDYTTFVSWGNYHGGQASTIWITSLGILDSVEIPHEQAADFSPVYENHQIFFLSGRKGRIGIFRYDLTTCVVKEVFYNTGPNIRSLSGEGSTLIYDQLGDIYLYDTRTDKGRLVSIEVEADLPEVRPSIKNVAGEIENASISPTGLRAVFEAHGEILTVPARSGPTRNITNTPGIMERWPSWSPDGQSIAYFSDESGLYALHIASQLGDSRSGSPPVRKYPLAAEPAYYFSPKWSPNSKMIAFGDHLLNFYLLDTVTGRVANIGGNNAFAGFSDASYDFAWSPDSKWVAFPRSLPNHLHALFLYSVDSRRSIQITNDMADSRLPAFDRDGKYLYFVASTNSGAAATWLDMSRDLYQVTYYVYAIVLAADQPSPLVSAFDDEMIPATEQMITKNSSAAVDPQQAVGTKAADDKSHPPTNPATDPKQIRIDLDGIQERLVALPLPAAAYIGLFAGVHGSLYFLDVPESGGTQGRAPALSRWSLEDRRVEKLAEGVESFDLSADGQKMLVAVGGAPGHLSWAIVPANARIQPGSGALSLADLNVYTQPAAEWKQIYHEVWRSERAYFYDPHLHGADILADERRFEPYVDSITSRADLNYIFQEMLDAFSVSHLRGRGGAIPEARQIPGGLLGADYTVSSDHYCLTKIYTGGHFNQQERAPLAQPGLNLAVGDCILAINGQNLTGSMDIQQPLQGTAGESVILHIVSSNGSKARDVTVVPIANDTNLRSIDWIETNQRRVDQLSDGKLAYIYLPNTAADGFADFNRAYFSQTQKQGAVIDERFNTGGQMADYIIEVMSRHIEAYWAPRHGGIEHTPNAAIYGPKVMVANECSGSGGDALAWLFKQARLGQLVGKRTWGGMIGTPQNPILMDGGQVTVPGVAFFSPKGEWEIENHGVSPDVVVEQDPKAVSEGRDPQLEMAVSLALDDLAQHPRSQPTIPAYPNYHP